MSPSSKCMCHKTYAHRDTHTRYSTPNTSTRASRAHNSDVGWFVTQDFPGNSDCRRKTVESLLPRPNACAKTHMHTQTRTQYITPPRTTGHRRAQDSENWWYTAQALHRKTKDIRKT